MKATDENRRRVCVGCGITFLAAKPSHARKFCGHVCKGHFYGNAAMLTDAAKAKNADARRHRGKPGNYVKREGRHEQRVVAERMLGRELQPGEVVRHRDRVKSNNSDENLQVMTRSEFGRVVFAEARQRKSGNGKPCG